MILRPHKRLISLLDSKGYNTKGKNYGEFDDSIFEILDENLNNIKGGKKNPTDYKSRFRDIVSDPNNLFIKRHQDAGNVENGILTLHNGIKLYSEYYGDFINILKYNFGVHEPSEERAFEKVLSVLKENSTMIELGSYWSMYSVWFMKTLKNSKSYCIESEAENLKLGIKNFELNGLTPNFFKGKVSTNGIKLNEFLTQNNIEHVDILHSDIQGDEMYMLQTLRNFLTNKQIKYLFISTHSDSLHYDCIKYLKSVDYKILCSCDFDTESFQFDGFLLSCPEELNEISPFLVGNRKTTPIISEEDFDKIIL